MIKLLHVLYKYLLFMKHSCTIFEWIYSTYYIIKKLYSGQIRSPDSTSDGFRIYDWMH